MKEIIEKSRTMKASKIKINNDQGMLVQLINEPDEQTLRKKSQDKPNETHSPMQQNEPQKPSGGTLLRMAGITGTPVVTPTPQGYVPRSMPGRKTEAINYLDPKNL